MFQKGENQKYKHREGRGFAKRYRTLRRRMKRVRRVSESQGRGSAKRRNKKRMPEMGVITVILGIILLSVLGIQMDIIHQERESGGQEQNIANTFAGAVSDELEVFFVDVGQGNCVIARQGEEILVYDAGTGDDAANEKIQWVLDTHMKAEEIDYLIISHYDSDHLGGAAMLLQEYEVSCILQPDYEPDTYTYETYREFLTQSDVRIISPSAGEEYYFGEGSFTVLTPPEGMRYMEENDNSIGIQLTFHERCFVFMGDAGTTVEADVCAVYPLLRADVCLISHHGSAYSTSDLWLDTLKPAYGIISVGAGNDYGHPTDSVLKSLEERDICVYRTDEMGTIQCVVLKDAQSEDWKLLWAAEREI